MKGTAGEIVAGRYRIERPIGSGGFGTVYIGSQINLDRPVAIKVMRQGPENAAVSRERFRREAVWTSTLNHPNVVVYHDFLLDDDDDMLLVMEFLDGVTLDEVIAAHGHVECGRAVRLTAGAARGLGEAHRAGLVHRDVKPSNIFVVWPGTPRERAKVIDFGILWADPEVKGEHDGLTRQNAFIGTPEYIAPEVLMGAPIDGRTDQYALALVALRAITGRKPWPSTTNNGLLARLGSRPVDLEAPVVAGVPTLAGVLYKALSPDPADRFADMDAFADALDDAVAARPDMAGEDGPTVVQVAGGSVGMAGVAVATARQSTDVAAMAGSPVGPGTAGDAAGPATQLLEPPRRRRALRIGMAVAVAVIAVGLGIAAGAVWSGGRGGMSMDDAGTPVIKVTTPAESVRTPPNHVSTQPDNLSTPADKVTPPVKSVSTPADMVNPPAPNGTGSAKPVVKPAEPRKAAARLDSSTLNSRGAATVRRPSTAVSGPPSATSVVPAGAAASGRGGITFSVRPWAYLSIDGRDYGQTPRTVDDLAAGNHTAVLHCPDTGRTETFQVVIRPGETIKKIVNLD